MSPRRKLVPELEPALTADELPRRRRWTVPAAMVLCAIVAAAAVGVCSLVLIAHEKQRRADLKDVEALGYVRSFMVEFTSPDPFHANDYTDRILASATGDFAEQYRENENQILVGVARSEPTTGTVLDAGISRWSDDGGVDVLVVTKLTSKSPDGKMQAERANRWVVTAKQEGGQWKISSLIPMI